MPNNNKWIPREFWKKSFNDIMSFYSLEFDGASRGNPGHAGAAAYLFQINNGFRDCVWFDSEYLGTKTNNQAEYLALILGLKECVNRGVTSLEVCGDSELVIRQLTGEYQVKHKKLKPLHKVASELVAALPSRPRFKWIPREENTAADSLANLVIDRELDGDADEVEEDDEIEERGENFGFTREELGILLSFGMKPWRGDYGECWDFVQAYKSGAVDEEGEPLWARYLSSSSMWDD